MTREELDRLPLSMNGAASGTGPTSIGGAGADRFQTSMEGSPRLVDLYILTKSFVEFTNLT